MIKMLFKLAKLLLSIAILFWMTSIFPSLGECVTIEGTLGFVIGVIYVKDPTGRYHYGFDGRFVSGEEGFCLKCLLPILGIAIPAAITIYSLPMFAIEELFAATFGAEFIGLFGGAVILE